LSEQLFHTVRVLASEPIHPGANVLRIEGRYGTSLSKRGCPSPILSPRSFFEARKAAL
jgi:hypothetical protein